MKGNETADRKLMDLEFLRWALSELENAVLDAYWRGNFSREEILRIVGACVGELSNASRFECPKGTVKTDDNMCEFPNGDKIAPGGQR